jgi:hypothetical protein
VIKSSMKTVIIAEKGSQARGGFTRVTLGPS